MKTVTYIVCVIMFLMLDYLGAEVIDNMVTFVVNLVILRTITDMVGHGLIGTLTMLLQDHRGFEPF